MNIATCVEGIDHKVIPRDDEPRSLVLNETDSVHAVRVQTIQEVQDSLILTFALSYD